MQDAFAYCARLVREADKDRFIASLFAPADRRQALFALYAFNVEIVRIGEAVSAPMPGEIRLQWWREALAGAREGEAEANPVAGALLAVIRRHELARDSLERLIDARAFDLYDDPMPSWQALAGYCARTDAALFALAAQILVPERSAVLDDFAQEAGAAHAIAAILADFSRQAARGRLFIPLEALDVHGARPADILAGKATAELRAALAEVRSRARRHLATAREIAPALPAQSVPAFLPLAPVRRLLDRLEKSDPFSPVGIPHWRRQLILWRAARRGLGRVL